MPPAGVPLRDVLRARPVPVPPPGKPREGTPIRKGVGVAPPPPRGVGGRRLVFDVSPPPSVVKARLVAAEGEAAGRMMGDGSPSVISFKLRPAGTIEEEEVEGEEEATGEDLTFPTRTLLAQLERLERDSES